MNFIMIAIVTKCINNYYVIIIRINKAHIFKKALFFRLQHFTTISLKRVFLNSNTFKCDNVTV